MIIDPNFKESYCLQGRSEDPSSAGFVNAFSLLVLFQFVVFMFLPFYIPSQAPGFCFTCDSPEVLPPSVLPNHRLVETGGTDHRFQQRNDWPCCLLACLLFLSPAWNIQMEKLGITEWKQLPGLPFSTSYIFPHMSWKLSQSRKGSVARRRG